MDGDQSICLSVVSKVADHEGTAPEDLHPPLHAAIDTDALEALFQAADPDDDHPSIEFTYRGYTIRVAGPDEISIEDSGSSANPQMGAV